MPSYVSIEIVVTDLTSGRRTRMTVPKAERPEVNPLEPEPSERGLFAEESRRVPRPATPKVSVVFQPVSDPKTRIAYTVTEENA